MKKISLILLVLILLLSGSMNVTPGAFAALAGRQAAMAEEAQPSGGEINVPSGGGSSGSQSSGGGTVADKPADPPKEESAAPQESGNGGNADPADPVAQSPEEPASDPAGTANQGNDDEAADGQESAPAEETEEPGEGKSEEEPAEEPDAVIPSFYVSGELDQAWLVRWKAGQKDGLKLLYTVSASAYDSQYRVCKIEGFGLKEIRDLGEDETEEDLMHAIGSSGKKFRFQAKKTSHDAKFTIGESFLDGLADGEYQIYALYANANGEEKMSVMGTISLPRPEKTGKSGPAPTAKVEATLGENGQMILKAKLDGFDGMDIQMQWQYRNGGDWKNVSGADGREYRFDPTEATNHYLWRVKVLGTGGQAGEEAPAADDGPVPEAEPEIDS